MKQLVDGVVIVSTARASPKQQQHRLDFDSHCSRRTLQETRQSVHTGIVHIVFVARKP